MGNKLISFKEPMKGMADVFGCYATSEKVRDTLFVIGKEQARCGLGI